MVSTSSIETVMEVNPPDERLALSFYYISLCFFSYVSNNHGPFPSMCYGNDSISTGHSHWTINASVRARDIANMLCKLTGPTEGSNQCQHQGFPAGKDDDPPYIVHLCTPLFSYFFFSLIMLVQILHGGGSLRFPTEQRHRSCS